jgi:hypothetical protein
MDLFPLVVEKLGANVNIRVLTDLKSSKHFNQNAYAQALVIHSILKKISSANLVTNNKWKQQWLKKAELNTKPSGVKEWFSGRASIPFKAVLNLEAFCSKEDFNLIKANCNYFCTKNSSPARFPRKISPELAWLLAAILCDGHLRANKEGVVFEVANFVLAEKFSKIFCCLFECKWKMPSKIKRVGRNDTFSLEIYDYAAMLFLNKIFGIPFGKKSSIIRVPNLIFDSTPIIKKAFLKGVFDTDGGRRGHGLGLTSLSEKFVEDVNLLLNEFGIQSHKEEWINRKYSKKCFGSRFKIDANSIFLLRQ